MSADKRVALSFVVKIRPSIAAKLCIEGKLPSFKSPSISDLTVQQVRVEVVKTWQAVYVSRPSERIVRYTGPCEEEDCDGYHVVGYLPREPDHGPDAMVAGLIDVLWDGSSMDGRHLREVLSKCEPDRAVENLLILVDKMDLPK